MDRSNTIQLQNLQNTLETINDFIYLGSLITNKGGCETEIKRRIALARTAIELSEDMSRQIHNQKYQKSLVNTLVFSIFSYGSESWIIKAVDRLRIDAFEM